LHNLHEATQGFYWLSSRVDLTEGRLDALSATLSDRSDDMKISARNVFKGKIMEVTKGATTAHVKIDIGGIVVTSSITNASVEELKLAAGKEAYAIIKASDVMVGTD
jgi:molybdopterin-binding protein